MGWTNIYIEKYKNSAILGKEKECLHYKACNVRDKGKSLNDQTLKLCNFWSR